MTPSFHGEATFESFIVQHLIESGWQAGHSNDFDAAAGLFPGYICSFLRESQPDAWHKLSQLHGEQMEHKIVQRIQKELATHGTLAVVRKGFTDLGVKFRMAYFKPETSLNPQAQAQYAKNQLTVTRQLYYQPQGTNSLDLVLSLNGLPIATVELKNQFTDQNSTDAKRQYVYDREPYEPIFQFKKRTLVHFAVDRDECYMTTRSVSYTHLTLPTIA